MARRLRLDYPGAMHHVFTRGMSRSAVALDDADYERSLMLLARAVPRFGLRCHAWCFLPNHSHLLLTSELGNLSRAMHWLGTCTAQSFNHRHEHSGHVYEGRFGSRLVEDEGYLLELARYVPLNPVRAGLCASPGDWRWSSYSATAGLGAEPAFLDTGALVDALGSRSAYVAWVTDGLLATTLDAQGVPRPPPRPALATLLADTSERAIAAAHFRHAYSKSEIARHLGISRAQLRGRLAPAS